MTRLYRDLTLLIAAAALTGACATGQPEAEAVAAAELQAVTSIAAHDAAMAQADGALERGAYDEAAKLYERAIQQSPGDAQARLGLAESYLGLGMTERSEPLFALLLDQPDTRLAAMQGRAISLLLQGDDAQAFATLSAVVAEQPNMWRSWNALGRYHDGRGEWAEAEAAYRHAFDAAPTGQTAGILNNLGVSAMAQGDHAAAIGHLTRALQQDRELDTAEANLRLVLAMEGRYGEAMAGVAGEDLPKALNNMGYIAMMQGDLGRAEAYLQRAIETSPSFYATASSNLALLAGMSHVDAPAPLSGTQAEVLP